MANQVQPEKMGANQGKCQQGSLGANWAKGVPQGQPDKPGQQGRLRQIGANQGQMVVNWGQVGQLGPTWVNCSQQVRSWVNQG
jgi:hypothetical protein